MAVTIKKITELPTGEPNNDSPIMFGIGDTIFRIRYDLLKGLINEDFINDLSFPVLETNITHEIGSAVNPLGSVLLTITSGQIHFIRFNVINENNVLSRDTYLIPLGAGVYNTLASVIGYDDLIRVDSKPTTTSAGDANTVTFTVSDLAEINASDPSLDLTDTDLFYFFEINGKLYRFVGTNGLYGLNDLQIVEDDLLQMGIDEIQLTPTIATPPLTGTFDIDLTNYLGTDYSGTVTSADDLGADLNPQLGGFARVKGNWPTKPNFINATEAGNSEFIPNVDLYLYVEKWADGVIYWYSES